MNHFLNIDCKKNDCNITLVLHLILKNKTKQDPFIKKVNISTANKSEFEFSFMKDNGLK